MITHFPALRFGKPYKSLDLIDLSPLNSDETIAQVSQVNAGIIKRDLRKIADAGKALSQFTTKQLIEKCATAGKIFTS